MRYDLLALPTAGLDQQLGFFSSTDTKQAFRMHRTPSGHVTGISLFRLLRVADSTLSGRQNLGKELSIFEGKLALSVG